MVCRWIQDTRRNTSRCIWAKNQILRIYRKIFQYLLEGNWCYRKNIRQRENSNSCKMLWKCLFNKLWDSEHCEELRKELKRMPKLLLHKQNPSVACIRIISLTFKYYRLKLKEERKRANSGNNSLGSLQSISQSLQ